MTNPGALQAVCMIPAATEWGYAPFQVYRDVPAVGAEFVQTENGWSTEAPAEQLLLLAQAQAQGLIGSAQCDWRASLDALQAEPVTISRVNLFVTWFGSDLNCGSCQLYPAVTQNAATYFPQDWAVAGIARSAAALVSSYGGTAAFGGTPSDAAVTGAIQDMHLRGLSVAFTPFILMDIPAGNTLNDPATGTAGIGAYPWRGRITCSHGTQKTSAVTAQVAAFVTRYSAFVLHYANLCAAAGGVDTFVLGTELRGLTWINDGAGNFPFVAALVSLASAVKGILPNANIVYAADWTEYFGYQPADGSNDVYFHLDPLWACPAIAAVGIDVYFPLADWRTGTAHLDAQAAYSGPHDLAYLQSNIRGGEGFDWFYASTAARNAQTRSIIQDGARNKPWVFRCKDIWSWWQNQHFNRPAGTESGTPTAWIPRSKPVWFTELGCPAVNFGANQPNVFHDAKSSESAYPYFSNGTRDDTAQGRYLAAVLRFFDPEAPGFIEANNPPSGIYNGRMVDVSRIYAYCWDARPFPFFPYGQFMGAPIWGDGPNYETGHWLQGRSDMTDIYGVQQAGASALTSGDAWSAEASQATGWRGLEAQ
jgi:GTA TIM-barrel-like domain